MSGVNVKLTPDIVRQRVEFIRSISGDDEAAHGAEDELYQEVLTALANGSIVDASTCAAEALKTSEIRFARWCA